jgi:hypothetical protein
MVTAPLPPLPGEEARRAPLDGSQDPALPHEAMTGEVGDASAVLPYAGPARPADGTTRPSVWESARVFAAAQYAAALLAVWAWQVVEGDVVGLPQTREPIGELILVAVVMMPHAMYAFGMFALLAWLVRRPRWPVGAAAGAICGLLAAVVFAMQDDFPHPGMPFVGLALLVGGPALAPCWAWFRDRTVERGGWHG